uniref:Serpin domain-containing protein n=1 Tax=Phocoena sinus TaxID=42100 RepID=A0A8C9B1C3_PHOSS
MRAEGMSPLLALGLLVAGLCSSVHCLPGGGLDPEDVTPEDQHKGAPVDDHTFVSSNTDFAFSLYKQLALKTSNENVIFSPLSVSMALAFLSLGARAPTLTETLEGLKFNLTETPETEVHQGFQHLVQTLGRPSDQLQLSLGNAVFVQEQLKLLDKFREDARALCASEAFSTDFWDSDTAKKLINGYVRNKTQGKIVELFKDLDKLTEMMLVKYIFSKSQWRKPFDPSHTYNKSFPFLVGKRTTVHVPMMHQAEQVGFGVDPELNSSVLQVDYSRDTVVFFVLPGEGKMRQLEHALSARTLKWSRSLQKRWVCMPICCGLRQMGIWDALDKDADFSGITKKDFLQVSKVNAFLGGDPGCSSHHHQTQSPVHVPSYSTICFNRSFMLLIINKATQTTLFLGKFGNPTKF